MNNSILLARLIGPFISIIAAGLFLNLKLYRQIIDDFSKNAALVYIAGLISFIIGLTLVLLHNIWVLDWRVIMTIFGWITLIKGIWLIVLPGTLVKIAAAYIKNFRLVIFPWAFMFLLGIFLIFKGY